MSKNYRLHNISDTDGGAIQLIAFEDDNFDCKRVDVVFNIAPALAGSVTVTKKNATLGSTYDCVVRSSDAVGVTSISIEDIDGFVKGDKLYIDYANPNDRTVSITAILEL
jgi:hypothetical protein